MRQDVTTQAGGGMTIDKIIAAIPEKSPEERKRMRENAAAWLASGDAKKIAAANGVIAALDACEGAEARERHERLSAMTPAQRLVAAFASDPLTETERLLVQALIDNPGETSTTLGRLIGWKGKSWHMHFGKMCKRREATLWPAAKFESRDAYFYSGMLTEQAQDEKGDWRFTLKPDLADAFATLGLRPPRRA